MQREARFVTGHERCNNLKKTLDTISMPIERDPCYSMVALPSNGSGNPSLSFRDNSRIFSMLYSFHGFSIFSRNCYFLSVMNVMRIDAWSKFYEMSFKISRKYKIKIREILLLNLTTWNEIYFDETWQVFGKDEVIILPKVWINIFFSMML